MRGQCHAEIPPAAGDEAAAALASMSQVRPTCTRTGGSRQPSNRSELALHLLAAVSFADSTLLTLIRCPHRGRLLVQRFPARPLHVPLRADRSAQGLSASSPAPPGIRRSQGGRGKECAPPSCSWAVHSPVVWHPNGRPLPKLPAISASNTNLGLTLIAAKTASMASWTERPGRNPYELGSKRASHSGSRASQTSVCAALVRIVGMPSGRFSILPGLGIHTRRTGCGLSVRESVATRARRWDGVRALTPSTPAVCLPRLSCVTRRTASHFADEDFINKRSRRWTAR